MSGLDSWEDDPAAQDESLSRQAQQNLNLNSQARTFQPGAASFQPNAQSFQPGQGYQQYGGGGYNNQYGQYYQQPRQQGNGNYFQYSQQGYDQGYNQGYNHGYGQQQNIYDSSYNQQYQNYQQQQQQQQQQPYQPPHRQQQQQQQQPKQTPVIAKRPTGDDSKPAAAPIEPKKDATPVSKAKVLSIGDTSTPPKAKVLSIGDTGTTAPKPKVLSIGDTGSTAKKAEKAPSADDGAKVAAAKAIEKTGEVTTETNGKVSSSPSSGKSSPTPAESRAQREADAVAKEQAAAVDEEILEEVYGKEHVNVIFIGHVDAGKSTLGGSILYATGMVDQRTMDKYKREAKEAGRETWYLSWALDLTNEERSKGKTVEVGRGFFETEKRRYSILDAPGHKTFVPNMIGGAAQADVGILVISARKGEYETGFEKGGQTREHAILAKTQGVNRLCIVVNKMDDPTVEWSQARYKECTEKLASFLRGLGYSKTDLTFMPISAQTTINIKDRIPDGVCSWYSGPSLLEYLDNLQSLERKLNAPFMMPVSGKYRDMGTMIEGKIEAGIIKKGTTYTMMPNREDVSISALYGETEDEIPQGSCGDQVRVRLRGIEEEDILPGFVLCSQKRLVHCVSAFEAQIVLLELKTILSAGFECVLHVHSAIEEVSFGMAYQARMRDS
ncbi:MAG: hypothetical protein LQ340_003266 [Diploschistes diacapsis]|nr:MAG: hypothetical protein LQ340_003266 [Diploschistes diacapsis]